MNERTGAFIAAASGIVGAAHCLTGEAMAAHLVDQKKQIDGRAAAVLLPSGVDQVRAIVAAAARHGVALVPQGGNTGLAAGAIPTDAGWAVVSLRRLRSIRAVDADNNSITVDAGVVLAEVQEAAAAANRLFPLSLGSEGSCQVGGVLSTNAGGISVLRYGMMRDLVLGLEVVLPDGTLWSSLKGLRKDNTGYDLKQLFLGAEGTLGIITGAVLKTFPVPARREAAFVAVPSVKAAVALLHRLNEWAAGLVGAYEYVSGESIRLAVAKVPGVREPLSQDYACNVLIELELPAVFPRDLPVLEGVLEQAMEEGLVLDGAIAASEAQRVAFWRLREAVVEALFIERGSISNDVSVPISRLDAFLEEGRRRVQAIAPTARVLPFGHFGDGNIHFNVLRPVDETPETHLGNYAAITEAVADVAVSMGGSFSAEHGIGRMKIPLLKRHKEAGALALMAKVKRAIDPDGLMNPGAVLDRPKAGD
jgi:FAD/FMN-containing dehydrogenase